MVDPEVVARLLAAIDEREQVARAASSDWERPSPEGGEHWHWVRSGHYDPLVDRPVDLDAEDPESEFIAEGNPVSIRSMEEYPTQHVGPLPHFVVLGEGETARGPARHIVMHDPAAVLRLCQSHRDIVAEYEEARKVPDELLAKRAHGVDVLIADAVAKALFKSVQRLARGYGVEDGED